MRASLAYQSVIIANVVLDFDRPSASMTFQRHYNYFKYHQRSQIIENADQPASLSEKLISKHTHTNNHDTLIF